MIEIIKEIDTNLFYFINNLSLSFLSNLLDPIMSSLSNRLIWIAIGLCALGYSLYKRDRNLILFCLGLAAAVTISDNICTELLKPGFARLRPCYALPNVHLVLDGCGSHFGFPSNHASNGMAVAIWGMLFWKGKFAKSMVLLTFLVGVSRVYVGVHYPFDVLGGFSVGAAVAFCVWSVFSSLIKSQSSNISR